LDAWPAACARPVWPTAKTLMAASTQTQKFVLITITFLLVRLTPNLGRLEPGGFRRTSRPHGLNGEGIVTGAECLDLLRVGACQVQQRRIPVDDMQGSLHESAGLDVAFPGGRGRHARAAFVKGALAGTQRSVAGDATGLWPAIVTGEEDQRVLPHLRRLERG